MFKERKAKIVVFVGKKSCSYSKNNTKQEQNKPQTEDFLQRAEMQRLMKWLQQEQNQHTLTTILIRKLLVERS